MEGASLDSYSLIPLGDHCFPSIALRDHNIRKKSYPFDWTMTHDIDFDILPEIFRLTKQLLITANPHELTEKYINDINIPGYKNSVGFVFPHETETTREALVEKYARRFGRMLTDIQTTKCIFIICTRFTEITTDDAANIDFFLNQNPGNKCLILSGVAQPNVIDDKRTHVEVVPYNRSDFYNYDYSVFRPRFMSMIINLLTNLIA